MRRRGDAVNPVLPSNAQSLQGINKNRGEVRDSSLRSPIKRIHLCGYGRCKSWASRVFRVVSLLTISCQHASAFALIDRSKSLLHHISDERYSTQLAFADSTQGDGINDSPFEKNPASSRLLTKSGSIELKKFEPPWLPASDTSTAQSISKAYAKYNLHLLQQALEKHVRLTGSKLFTMDDARIVIEAVFAASKGKDGTENYTLVGGAADFLVLLLSVEEYNNNGDDRRLETYGREIVDYYTVMTRDALVASAFHYCDCVLAREAGIYDIIESLMRSTTTHNTDSDSGVDARFLPESLTSDNDSLLTSTTEGNSVTVDIDVVSGPLLTKVMDADNLTEAFHFNGFEEGIYDHIMDDGDESSRVRNAIHQFDEDAVRISQSAARIKRAEIMSHSVLPNKIKTVTPSHSEAASLRGLLLSVTDDWRSLIIRSSACLYRLRGIIQNDRQSLAVFGLNDYEDDSEIHSFNNMQIVREAREALTVYAPLSERLGMHRLKSELENAAFRVLYKRQYNVVQSIYAKSGATIQSVTDYLTRSIEEILNSDTLLSSQLERLTVTSRVKKPYSLWKKLLKLRLKNEKDLCLQMSDPLITLIPDAIAMRVILKAKRINPLEEEPSVRSREELLCSYIQNRLMTIWPAMGHDRIKDYITNPKSNGYQSLHYTASIFRYGSEWPFEVQIRSEDMHTKSEYGAAAHWDYKLNSSSSNIGEAGSIKKKDLQSTPLLLNGASNTIESEKSILESGSILLVEDDGISNIQPQRLTRASTLESYIEALSLAREHLVGNSAFVFFLLSSESKGKVIGVPIGSTVADVLEEFHSRYDQNLPRPLANNDIDVFLNGAKASVYDVVKTGDTIFMPSLEVRMDTGMFQ